jgi:hypothetical protein
LFIPSGSKQVAWSEATTGFGVAGSCAPQLPNYGDSAFNFAPRAAHAPPAPGRASAGPKPTAEETRIKCTVTATPAGITRYVQDLDGRPIYEATGTGMPLREYIWVDDMPVAVFADLDTASPQLYYVHPDHLNRPLRMTDGSKAVVWDAVYRPFGEVHAIGGSASLNLRFPGQYFLLEHGLHYNWHRKVGCRTNTVNGLSESSDHSAAAATAARGQDGLGIGCHHLAMPRSCAITFAAL